MDIKSHKKCVARIILTFDDGRRDNYKVASKVLLPRKLPATFSITTGYVDGSIQKADSPCDNASLTQEEVKALHAMGLFEIAGHGHEHLNSVEDWGKGIDMLERWLGKAWRSRGVGIASPHSSISAEQIRERKAALAQLNVSYVRIALKNQFSYPQRIISRLARMLRSRFLYTLVAKASLQGVGEDTVVYSVPILHPDTAGQVIALIKMAEREQKDCVLMLHSILKEDEANYDGMWSWDYNRFVELCDFLAEERDAGRVDVVTLRDMFGQ